jgi:hypothetical protein
VSERWRDTALLVAAGVVLGGCDGRSEASAQEWQTTTSARAVAGEQSLGVAVEYGAGTLTLARGESGTLYRTNVRFQADVFTPTVEYDAERLKVSLSGSTARRRNIRGGELDLQLTPDVPIDLNLQFGAAEARLDLGGLLVRQLEVQTGASRTTLTVSQPNEIACERARIQVGAARFEATGLGNLNTRQLNVQGGVGEVVLDFTGAWAADMDARVEMGLGSLTLRLPTGLGVSVRRSGVLASFDSQGLVRRGDVFYSENWEHADRKLSLSLDAALGSIRVVWVDS